MKGAQRVREMLKIALNVRNNVLVRQLVIVILNKIFTTVKRIPVSIVMNHALHALTVGAMTV